MPRGRQKFELLVGREKNMMIYYEKSEYKGVRGGKKGGKRTFSMYLEEKISFWNKGGGGKNINYLDTMHPCVSVRLEKCLLLNRQFFIRLWIPSFILLIANNSHWEDTVNDIPIGEIMLSLSRRVQV